MNRDLIIDFDTHVVEPRDAWSRYAEPKATEGPLSIIDVPCEEHGVSGKRPHLALGGRQLFSVGPVIPVGLAAFDERLSEAGATEDSSGATDAATLADIREILVPLEVSSPPEGHDGLARLAWMDRVGIARSVVCPTWGLMWEQYLTDRPDVVTANMRSYNRWLADFCAPDPHRLVGAAELTLLDVDWAVAEIARVARAGFRVARVRPTLHGGKPLAHPDHERFWTALVEHDLRLVFHIDGAGTRGDTFLDVGWYQGESRGPASGVLAGCMPHVPAMATLTGMFHGGVFERHPSLRLGLLELGAGWLAPYLTLADQVLRIARGGRGRLPSEIAATQIWMSPLEAEDLDGLLARSGGPRLCFGSDYPHPEASQDPVTVWSAKLGDVSREQDEAFFGRNAASFLA